MSTIKSSFLILLAGLTLFSCREGETESPLNDLDLASIAPKTGVKQNGTGSNQQISDSRVTAITRAVDDVSDAICGINVTQIREYRRSPFYDDPFFRNFFRESMPRQAVKSLGSGFLISSDGFVLTNEHVVHNASEIVVVLSDGSTEKGTLVGSDFISDIALIKIEGSHYPYVAFGNSDEILIGEWAIALGNPFGLFEINAKPTVTVGVVSAVDRDFGRVNENRVYQDMIQTDAAINRGNSGGPLLNSLGQVIGMNAFIYTSETSSGSIGLGFAIPSNRIQRVLRDLKQYGQVNRSWRTGLVVQEITPWMADYFRLNATYGTIITEIERNSSADRAGLKTGDVILEVNEQKIRDENDIYTVIDNADLRAGDILNLKILREEDIFTVKLKLESVSSK